MRIAGGRGELYVRGGEGKTGGLGGGGRSR